MAAPVPPSIDTKVIIYIYKKKKNAAFLILKVKKHIKKKLCVRVKNNKINTNLLKEFLLPIIRDALRNNLYTNNAYTHTNKRHSSSTTTTKKPKQSSLLQEDNISFCH